MKKFVLAIAVSSFAFTGAALANVGDGLVGNTVTLTGPNGAVTKIYYPDASSIVVKGADGSAMDGALVTLLDASGKELPKDYALSSIFSLTTDKTDANGQCRLRGVAAGKYIVQAVKGELKARSALVEVFEGGSTTVEVALPGGRLGDRQQRFGGAPQLEPDVDYVLFLWTGPSGRTQITGFSQGVCELSEGPDGSRRVVRRASSDVVLTPDGSAAGGDGRLDLALEEFSRRVKAAVEETAP